MGLFNNFPWTNFHELNLDWLIEKVKEIEAAFPEGLVGIPKGGTGADNAADARSNLEIAGDTIPAQIAIPNQTIADVITILYGLINDVDSDVTTLDNKVKYTIVKDVSDIPNQTIGTATISSVWSNMTPPVILITNPQQFAAGQMPNNFGILVLIKNIAGNGCAFFVSEDKFYTNYFSFDAPTTTWLEYYNDDSVIPISNGGTGATNAADALTNLGIDFSGEVLSVAGVGANPTGDVPLEASDLNVNFEMYSTLTQLGLPSGSSTSAVWTAIGAQNGIAIIDGSDISDSPIADGIIVLIKNYDSTTGIIKCFPKTSGEFYTMFLSGGSPSGTWVINNRILDGSASVTHSQGTPARCYLYKVGSICFFEYQSVSRQWAATQKICEIPSGFRPTVDAFFLVAANNAGNANVHVEQNGDVTINQLTTISGNSRIYINGWWYSA